MAYLIGPTSNHRKLGDRRHQYLRSSGLNSCVPETSKCARKCLGSHTEMCSEMAARAGKDNCCGVRFTLDVIKQEAGDPRISIACLGLFQLFEQQTPMGCQEA